MAKTLSMKGTARLSKYGKRMVTESMWVKGHSFIDAAILLKQQGGSQYVVLHLLCQGLEIMLKSFLLMHDYDFYQPKLKGLGHNLEKIADTTLTIFKLKKLDQVCTDELRQLNQLFTSHWLRYGTSLDIFVDPISIPYKQILRKTLAVIRFVRRKNVFLTMPSNH